MLEKFIKIFLYLSFFSSFSSYAQWVVQPGSFDEEFKISFVDANTGNTVGGSGTIFRTTNGGINWFPQVSNTTAFLEDVQLLNSQTGFVCGWGPIERTTNGGNNWISLNPPGGIIYYGIYFFNINTGFACGQNGTLIETTNGGSNWIQLTVSTTNNLNRVKFYNQNTGYVVGNVGTILKTTDGGNTWNQLVSGVTATLHSLSVINSDTVYVCGDGINVLKTVDGGVTFLPLTGSPTTTSMYDIYFTNYNTGTIVGTNHLISRTTDGGLDWVIQYCPVNVNLYGVYFVSNDTGYVSGVGVVMRTNTGGYSPPHPPTMQLPPNGAQNVSITPHLKWDTVSGSDVYNLQISSDTSFNNPIFDTSGIVDTFCNVRSGLLSNNLQYFWRVRSHNFVGYGSWPVSPFGFTTIVGIPGPPNLLLPTYGATNVSLNPLFQWDSTSPATYYWLQACYDSSFSIDRTPINQTISTAHWQTDAQHTLRNNTRYYWRVRTTNAAGNSIWSNIFWFSTLISFPPQPILLAPPNNDTNVSLTPILQWVGDVSAINYQLEISKTPAFDSLTYNNSTITTSLFIVPVGILTNYQKYYWRVRTTNSLGTSNWSDTWNFTTALSLPAPPQLISPFDTATNVSLTPLLIWGPYPYSTYHAQVATDTLFTNQSFVVNVSGLTQPQYQILAGALNNGVTYYWRVNATNSAGTGLWSTVWLFTTIVAAPVVPPILLSPPNHSTNVSGSPTLYWTEANGSTDYELQLSQDSIFNTNFVIDSINIPVTHLTVRYGLLVPYTKYYWHARGHNVDGNGPWSETWDFTTGLIGIKLLGMHIPAVFKLYNNYPNPFNPSTKIKFDIPEKTHSKSQISHIKMVVYDILGRLVSTIYEGDLYPGSYEINWNAGNIASGIYLYRLVTDQNVSVKKMVFLK